MQGINNRVLTLFAKNFLSFKDLMLSFLHIVEQCMRFCYINFLNIDRKIAWEFTFFKKCHFTQHLKVNAIFKRIVKLNRIEESKKKYEPNFLKQGKKTLFMITNFILWKGIIFKKQQQ